MFYVDNGKRLGLIIAILIGTGLLAACQQTSHSTSSQPAGPKPSQEQLQKLELLNQTADNMYKKVMDGDVPGGRAVLQQLSEQIPEIRYSGIASVDGMNALTETVTDAKRVFNAARFSPDEGQVSAAKIRLAADALTHKAQPMWLQYYKLLQDDLDRLEQSGKERKKQQLQSTAAQLQQHVSIIHPSLLISRDSADVEKLDSLISFIAGQARSEQESYKQIDNVLPTLRQLVDKLFLKKESTAYLPLIDQQNPIVWTLAIGSVIVAALAFAGWRLAQKDGGLVTVRKKDQG
jgi:sporulation protein YpjB